MAEKKLAVNWLPMIPCMIVLLGLSGMLRGLQAQTIKDTSDAYFSVLENDFNAIAASPIVAKNSSKPTEKYFIKELKRHQPFYMLIRTNSKGRVVSEMIRGEKKSRKNRNISRQDWYRAVTHSLEEYHGSVLEGKGRYYLFWSKPVIKAVKGSPRKKHFDGAIAVKIDLWDCFREISENTANPFLVRLHKLSLFSNKWKNDSKFFEDTLQVPGVKQITIRIESNSGTTTFAVDSFTASVKKADSVAAAAAALAAQAPVKKAAVKIHTPNRTILLIIVAVILLIIIVIIVRLISWFRMQSIMKNIEKDDSL